MPYHRLDSGFRGGRHGVRDRRQRADRPSGSARSPEPAGKADSHVTGSRAGTEDGKGVRVVVVGLGIQGKKRLAIAGSEVCATVDTVQPQADYRNIQDVPLDEYDAALVCTPDTAKLPILRYLLDHGKHVLVE